MFIINYYARVNDMQRIMPQILSDDEFLRYSRHLIIPEVGLEGQKRLRDSSVLIVGAGGLGNPASIYLAAAGIGNIGIVDFDNVEISNLQRQILYHEDDIGKPKAEVAKERLLSINPRINVKSYKIKIDSSNAIDILSSYDIVIDGTDNFPTRYLLNDACTLLGKPYIYASIFRFDGQVSVFYAKDGPCYRCLFPRPPPPDSVPTCAEGGVLGVLPGIIGSIQAIEAIKLILGKGDVLIGRLLLFDALDMKFTEIKIAKRQDCILCGNNRTIDRLIDYEEFCGLSNKVNFENEIKPEELMDYIANNRDVVIIDVREPFEHDIYSIPNSLLIPLAQLPSKVNELSTSDEIVVYCHTGARGAKAMHILNSLGFKKVRNLSGGILAWAALQSRLSDMQK